MIFIILGMIFLCMYLYKRDPSFPIGYMMAEVGIVGLMWLITMAVVK